jgi:hypothetical protein
MAANATPGRFACLSDDDFKEHLKNKDSANTLKATKKAVNIFRAYLQEKGQPDNFEALGKLQLAKILERFYAELRKTDGDYYKTASVNGIRTGINRHLKNASPGSIDIIKDSEFTAANMSFKASLVQLKKIGKGDVKHHSSIDENDIEALYRSGVFNRDSPVGFCTKFGLSLCCISAVEEERT